MSNLRFDADHAVERAGDDPELARTIGELFVEHVPHWIAELRTAIENGGEPKTAQRLAHTIKSSADNTGCHRVRSLAEDLERRIPEDGPERTAEAFADLVAAVDEVLPEVARFTVVD